MHGETQRPVRNGKRATSNHSGCGLNTIVNESRIFRGRCGHVFVGFFGEGSEYVLLCMVYE
jgi:hypothetical protein